MGRRDLYTNTEHDAGRYEAAHNEDDFDPRDVLDREEYGELREQWGAR